MTKLDPFDFDCQSITDEINSTRTRQKRPSFLISESRIDIKKKRGSVLSSTNLLGIPEDNESEVITPKAKKMRNLLAPGDVG